MSFINYATKEINCKIIYFGPGLSGKTTNIQYIYEHTQQETAASSSRFRPKTSARSSSISCRSPSASRGYKTRFHLYTIPGQTFYEVSRQFILKGVDGIVFVADSQAERMEANIESYEVLRKPRKQGYDINKIPLVFQYNKRDMPGAVASGNSKRHSTR